MWRIATTSTTGALIHGMCRFVLMLGMELVLLELILLILELFSGIGVKSALIHVEQIGMLAHELLSLGLDLVLLSLDHLLLEQILSSLLFEHDFSTLGQFFRLAFQPILLRLSLYRLFYLELSKPPLVFDLLFLIVLLELHLLSLDYLFIGHGLNLQLLIYHQAVRGVG